MPVISYNGNRNLKPYGIEVEFTPVQLEEYGKCANDAIYFINNYVKIVTLDHGLVQMTLRAYQKKMVQEIIANRRVVMRAPRQSGKTETVAAVMLWYVLFHEDYAIAILANKADQAREILSRVQLGYEHIPLWLQQGVSTWNKGDIELENRSSIITGATSSSAIRGRTINFLYMDEFAHIPGNIQEEFFTSVYPVISSGKDSKLVITSTPKGMEMFWKIWTEADPTRDQPNGYIRVDVHWREVPGRDDKWRDETIKATSELQFEQEFECSFLGSSNTLINGKKLATLTHISPIHENDTVCIYADPHPDHHYVCVVDTSRGSGLDFSAFVMFDITESPYSIVMRYRNNQISHLVYPQYVYEFSHAYNDAFILVETNDIGQVVSDILYNEYEYENMFLTQSKGRTGQQVGGGFGGVVPTFGVRTTTPVKRIGCVNLKSLVEGDKLIINDYQVLYELSRFISKKNSFEAQDGAHDDLVMCCVLFAWLIHQEYFKEMSNTDIRRSLHADNEQIINDSLLPFGIISDGLDENDEIFEEMPESATNAFSPKSIAEEWRWMFGDEMKNERPLKGSNSHSISSTDKKMPEEWRWIYQD